MTGSIDCAFLGRFGQHPELKTSAAGDSWSRLTLAVGYRDNAHWVSVVVFGKDAEHICANARKNDRLYFEGSIALPIVATKAEPPPIGRQRSNLSRAHQLTSSDIAYFEAH
jgi:Single-strand binding protein family